MAATVINARWAKPLDEALIAEHAAGKRLVVTAEESAAMGGFGDGVLDALNRAGIHVPLHKVALAEGFVHHGAVDDLRRQQRIDAAGILAQVREALGLPSQGASPEGLGRLAPATQVVRATWPPGRCGLCAAMDSDGAHRAADAALQLTEALQP